MESDIRGTGWRHLYYALAGLEVGVYGGLAMLAWFILYSGWRSGDSWRIPNLLASTFYGDDAFSGGSAMVTLSGIALHLFTSGTLGLIFGLLVREMRSYFRVALLALILGIGWYYFSYMVVWKRINPLVPLYSSYTSMLLAHIIYGAVLGRYPRCLAGIRRAFRPIEAGTVSAVDC